MAALFSYNPHDKATARSIIEATGYAWISTDIRDLLNCGFAFPEAPREVKEVSLALVSGESESTRYKASTSEDMLRLAQALPQLFRDTLAGPVVSRALLQADTRAWGHSRWDGSNYAYIPTVLSIGSCRGGLGIGTAPAHLKWWREASFIVRL